MKKFDNTIIASPWLYGYAKESEPYELGLYGMVIRPTRMSTQFNDELSKWACREIFGILNIEGLQHHLRANGRLKFFASTSENMITPLAIYGRRKFWVRRIPKGEIRISKDTSGFFLRRWLLWLIPNGRRASLVNSLMPTTPIVQFLELLPAVDTLPANGKTMRLIHLTWTY